MNNTRFFGDYNVIKQIGLGSLGAVYLVEHRFIKRHFALKLLPEELSSDRPFIQRLEEEIGILANLEHPNIVKMHNISFAQGQYFLITDCIVDEVGETTNLAQYLLARKTQLDEATLFRLLHQIAEALTYAQTKKIAGKAIAHRGLKLNNILIGKAKGNAFDVYLSDFGLSRIIGTGAILTRTYSNVAEALGISQVLSSSKNASERYPSPAIDPSLLIPLHASFLQNFSFLAPEQKRWDASTSVDAKADTYAFGVLTYYLLMNEFPEGIFEMPSTRHPSYEYDWDSLISHCLQKDPNKRPECLLESLKAITIPRQAPQELLPIAPPKELFISETSFSKTPARQILIDEEPEKIESPPLVMAVAEQAHDYNPTTVLPKIAPTLKTVTEAPQFSSAQNKALKPVIQTAEIERPQTDQDPASVFQIDTTVKYYVPERKEVKNIQPIASEMVIIPGGAFWRGSNNGNRDEMPYHQVTLDDFAVDIHPITNEQFVRFLDVMGGEKDSNHHDIIRTRDSRIKRSAGKLSIESGYAKHPVVGVTWYGAIAYAKWVGKRLPTEAEWEIAAHGGLENALYPTGDDIEKTQANFFSSDTTPVMSYAPNGYGLYDMTGNVYEWCHDWYGYNYYEVSVQEPENPLGPLQGVYRVLKGGCWKSLKEDLHCSRRHRNNPGTVNGTYGFRCAANVE